MCFSDARSSDKQDVDRLVQKGQAGQFAYPSGGEAGLEIEVELLQRAQHREARPSDAGIDRAVGLIGELQLDEASQVGSEARLTLGGAIRFGFEGGGHAVQAEPGQLALEHAALGLG